MPLSCELASCVTSQHISRMAEQGSSKSNVPSVGAMWRFRGWVGEAGDGAEAEPRAARSDLFQDPSHHKRQARQPQTAGRGVLLVPSRSSGEGQVGVGTASRMEKNSRRVHSPAVGLSVLSVSRRGPGPAHRLSVLRGCATFPAS